jgi:hypothetical protein
MISIEQIQSDLTVAMKAKDSVAMDVLRGLKTRIQNAKIAKQKELSEADLVALIRSEVKKRKEAAQSYTQGQRAELAEKEQREAEILQKYLPVQMSETELIVLVEKTIAENNFVAKDFGAAMGKIKSQAGERKIKIVNSDKRIENRKRHFGVILISNR